MDLGDALSSFTRGVVELQLFGSLATSCQVTSRRPPNNVAQQTARSSDGRPFELRSSRLLELSSRLLCSISNVELHCSLECDSPGQNSRADTNCTENNCARSILARTRLFRRAGDHMTFWAASTAYTAERQVQCRCDASGEVPRATQTQQYTRAHKTN